MAPQEEVQTGPPKVSYNLATLVSSFFGSSCSLFSYISVIQNSAHVLAGKAANEAKKLGEEEPARYDTFGGPDCTLTFS